MQAQALFDLGISRKDPLATLAAARLAAGIATTDSPRRPDPADGAAAARPAAAYPAADVMFTVTRALASGDALATDLAARAQAEAARLPLRSVIRATADIAAGQAQVWRIPFFAAAPAEVGLLGDGKANLDLTVSLGDAAPLCRDSAPADRALCTFVPAENATFTVTVTNRSETAASYSLLTN